MKEKIIFAIFILISLGTLYFAWIITRHDLNQMALKQAKSLPKYYPITLIPTAPIKKPSLIKPCQEHTFEKYIEEYIYSGIVSKPDFTSNPKRIYSQLALVNATFGGVNFAGFIVLAHVKQADGTQEISLIDARDGKIVDHGMIAETGIDFRKDSRLIIVNPPQNGKSNGNQHTKYYVFDSTKPVNETLKLVCEIK